MNNLNRPTAFAPVSLLDAVARKLERRLKRYEQRHDRCAISNKPRWGAKACATKEALQDVRLAIKQASNAKLTDCGDNQQTLNAENP